MLIRSGALDVVVIDSVAALVPRAEIEGEMGDTHVGLQARLMSQALRKITANLNRSKTTAVFINQLREKIGVMFGSPETTPGGRALTFYSSVRLDIRRIEAIKDGGATVGTRVRVKVAKNSFCANEMIPMQAWTVFTRKLTGFYTSSNIELVLLATRGSPAIKHNNGAKAPQVVYAPITKHSEKPNAVQERIDWMYPEGNRLELFARRPYPGWDTFGNQLCVSG